ncbi:MAG TPA: sarcosine oxidase subunit delta [Actinobacteria bacterium]|nr:sarcosine oxidase subunit delta [Actinomycetota bacterium]
MLLIECPHCGPRNGTEFTYSGKIQPRPVMKGSDFEARAEWRRYLYEEDNFAGFAKERWFHGNGCRKFLDIERHSVTNEISSVSPAGEAS